MNKPYLRGLGLFGAATLLATPIFAQNEVKKDDEIFELSPFNVDASEESGYRANKTLAGTRLNSSLGDLAAPISVFTKEFLDDIGATSIQDAYLYSVNTENENEYASNDTEGTGVASTNENRVRGLVASTHTRGFFNTQFRGDTYNSERFTLASGPNSILYGIGSPAGLMDTTLKAARTTKNSYEFQFRFDSENGKRATIDVNHVLVDDKLAIRLAAMEQNLETWRDPEIDDETRKFAAITYRPFENTTLSANYEDMKNHRAKARALLARDEVSQWKAAGSPYYNAYNDTISYDQGATWQDSVIAPSTGALTKLSALNAEEDQQALGFDRDTGGYFENNRVYMHGSNSLPAGAFSAIQDPAIRSVYEGMGMQGLIFFDFVSTVGHADPNYPRQTFGPNDTLVPTDLNIHGLASNTQIKGENYSFKIEQKIAKGLFAELAFNHEEYSSYFVDPIRGENSSIFVDINPYIPLWDLRDTVDSAGNFVPSTMWDGLPAINRAGAKITANNRYKGMLTDERLRNDANNNGLIEANDPYVLIPNPNLGRYYVEGQLIGFDESTEQDNIRFTTSYELDLTENNKWLGKHALAFLYQKDDVLRARTKLRAFNGLSHHVGAGVTVADIGDGQNNLTNRYYLDLPGAPDANGLKHPGTYELADPAFWPQVLGGYASAGDGKPVVRKNEVVGKMGVLQSRFFNNRLITTYGIRNDKETQWGDRALNPGYDQVTGEWIADPIPADPYFSDDGTTSTMGAVYKATDWLTVFYNKADSYQPQGQYESIYNVPLKPANGDGKDYGFMLDLMDGKLSARFSWFEQTANGALETDWQYNRVRNNLIQATENAIMDWWEMLTPENFGTATPEQIAALAARRQWAANLGLSIDDVREEFTSYSDFARFIRDFETKGMEIELFAKPVKNLDLVLTFGESEAKNLRSLPGGVDLVNERLPVWEKYFNLPRVPTNTTFITDFLDPSKDKTSLPGATGGPWNPSYLADPSNQAAINHTASVGYRYLTDPNGGAIIAMAQEEVGKANTRARKYRGNLVANYRFDEGALKGVGVGGATRWRSKAAIGYWGKPNPVNPNSILLAPDSTRPIWGEEILEFDLWFKYQRKLSIGERNVNWRIQLNIRNLFDTDDIVPVNAHTDGSIIQWDQETPRTWSLTNTFSF